MKIVERPDLQVFASEAKTGEVISFPDVLRGWGVTLDQTQGKPPLEWMNGAFNRIDLNNLYLLQQGIPEWHKSIRYPVNSIVKKADKIYLCIAENENNEPSNNSDKWALYVRNATTSQKGIVQLTSTLSDDEGKGATPKMVNDTDKKAAGAQKRADDAHTALAKKLDTSKVKTALSASIIDVPAMKLLNDLRNELLSKEVEVLVDQIFIFDGAVPAGYVERKGQVIDKATMPKLFARYGAKMPDDRDRVHRMSGTLAGSVGTAQEDAIRNITGSFQSKTSIIPLAGAFYSEKAPWQTHRGTVSEGGSEDEIIFDASREVPTASENRVKSRIVIFCNKIQ